MNQDHVDNDNLTVTGRHSEHPPPNLAIDDAADGTLIVVTQAFGPKGDNLVGVGDAEFDGHAAVSIGVRTGDREGIVHLSPIHGDKRKAGFTEIEAGAHCELFCPVSKEPLDYVGDVEDGSGARYFAIYLTPKLKKGSAVMVSDVWGHYHSRIVDDMELISYWATTHDES